MMVTLMLSIPSQVVMFSLEWYCCHLWSLKQGRFKEAPMDGLQRPQMAAISFQAG